MNFYIQSRQLLLLIFICLVSLTIQAKQSSTSAADSQMDLNDQSALVNDANRMILIKYLKKAFNEMNVYDQAFNDDVGADDGANDLLVNHRAVRADAQSNNRLKEFFIKRAMKNVALGFGKK
jgi:hypothetical protein